MLKLNYRINGLCHKDWLVDFDKLKQHAEKMHILVVGHSKNSLVPRPPLFLLYNTRKRKSGEKQGRPAKPDLPRE